MSQHEKLKERFLEVPNDFAYQELKKLLGHLGYVEIQGRGSRVKFMNATTNHWVNVHKPHPENVIKPYMLKKVIKNLKEKGVV